MHIPKHSVTVSVSPDYIRVVEAILAAGFTDTAIEAVFPTASFDYLICPDSETGEYLVSRWYGRDFSGSPDFEGSRIECYRYVMAKELKE